MAMSLENIKTLKELDNYLNQNWCCRIRKRGGRVFTSNGVHVKLNTFVKTLQQIAASTPSDLQLLKSIVTKIRKMDDQPISCNSLLRVLTAICRLVGNLFYNREKILRRLENGERTTSENHQYRHLVFQQSHGSVSCRVHGVSHRTFPRVSKDSMINLALRTILRMKNLAVFRTKVEGAVEDHSMIGPCDFYGPLEMAHQYQYTISIENGFPVFFRRNKGEISSIENREKPLSDFSKVAVRIEATWHHGNQEGIEKIKALYASTLQNATGQNLFPNSGILEIEQEKVELPVFDATKFDLTSFKVRLVRNDLPFTIAESEVSSTDSFCPVSYFFGDQYAQEQVEHGGGTFLETHDFCQTMTPLNAAAKGIVVLGRWADESHTVLELIGVKIPYGYTLIVEKDAIHGDATLKGMYMMAMTSNHKTMSTADVVFLKDKKNRKNFLITEAAVKEKEGLVEKAPTAPKPIVCFKQESRKEFNREINKGWPFYNPFSRILTPLALLKRPN